MMNGSLQLTANKNLDIVIALGTMRLVPCADHNGHVLFSWVN